VKRVLSNRDAPYPSAKELAPAIGSSMSAARLTMGVSKTRARVVPLPLGVCGMPHSARTAVGKPLGGATLASFVGVERDSSTGRGVERARAADRSPKMSPTGLDRSTRLNVKGVFFRFLDRAVGVWSGSSSKERTSFRIRSRSMLREGERCRRGVSAGGEEAERRRSLGRAWANSMSSFDGPEAIIAPGGR
jgi:hypothetical protein